MGTYSGERIRITSIVMLTITLLASIAGGIWLIVKVVAWAGLLVLVAGSLLSFLLFVVLYAFGDLVSDAAESAANSGDMLTLLQSIDEKLSVLERMEAARPDAERKAQERPGTPSSQV